MCSYVWFGVLRWLVGLLSMSRLVLDSSVLISVMCVSWLLFNVCVGVLVWMLCRLVVLSVVCSCFVRF